MGIINTHALQLTGNKSPTYFPEKRKTIRVRGRQVGVACLDGSLGVSLTFFNYTVKNKYSRNSKEQEKGERKLR